MVIKICSRLVCNISTNIVWHDKDDYCNDDGLIELYDGYKARKAQKASIKEGFLSIAWHPSR